MILYRGYGKKSRLFEAKISLLKFIVPTEDMRCDLIAISEVCHGNLRLYESILCSLYVSFIKFHIHIF